MNHEKLYKFYSDAGHGWLAVKRDELVELNLLNSISTYSYQRGKTVYLEEDCDMSKFIDARRVKIRLDEKYTERSPIRSYDSFKANTVRCIGN
jgi:hypothetical protein